MNVTNKQWLAIGMVILGALTASTAQLTDIFGPTNAKYIISVAGLCNTILGGVMAIISGQASLVRDVQAMPGVEKILVNSQANQTLAQVAVDEANQKVEPLPQAEKDVMITAHKV